MIESDVIVLRADRDNLHQRVRELLAEIAKLRAENAEQKAEMQKLYDNWSKVVRVAT